MSQDLRFLHSLLPRVIRRKDDEAGQVMARLLDVIQDELDEMEGSVDCLYDTWFVETCPPQYLPLLAETVGMELDPFMPPLPSHRRWIANIMRYRRDKGTLKALRDVLSDASGWQVAVREVADSLALTSSVRHMDADQRHTGRDPVQTVHVGSGAKQSTRGDQLRVIEVDLDRRTYAPIVHTQMAERIPGCFQLHPLGIDVPLFAPQPGPDAQRRFARLNREMLHHALHDATNTDGANLEDLVPVRIWNEQESIPMAHLNVVDLDTWRLPGPATMAGVGNVVQPENIVGEIQLMGPTKRTLVISEAARTASHAAELLQKAIRSGAKQADQKAAVVRAVHDRLVIVFGGAHSEVPFHFTCVEGNESALSSLGLDSLAPTPVLISHGIDHRELSQEQHIDWVLHRGDEIFPIRIQPVDTPGTFAAALQDALEPLGDFHVDLVEGQLLIVPPMTSEWSSPYYLSAEGIDLNLLRTTGLNPQFNIDPERGRLTGHIGHRGPLFADWTTAMDGDTGCTPLPRPLSAPADNDWCARVSIAYARGNQRPGFYKSIQAAVLAWQRSGRDGTIRVDDSGRYGTDKSTLKIDLNGRRLRIESSASLTPCVPARVSVVGNGGRLELSGIHFSSAVQAQAVGELKLEHCTILRSIHLTDADESTIQITKCITGPLVLPKHGCRLSVVDSVIDGHGEEAISAKLGRPTPAARLDTSRSTFVGDVHVRSVEQAVDTFFVGTVISEESLQGQLRHCGSSELSAPGCIVLGEIDVESEDTKSFPLIAREFGQPGYAVMTENTVLSMGELASNGSEIGVYNYLFNQRRMHLVQRTLDQFVPVGWSASIRIAW